MRRSYSFALTWRILCGVCSAMISSATCPIKASQSGGGIGVVSVTFSLWRNIAATVRSGSSSRREWFNPLQSMHRLKHQQRLPQIPAGFLRDPLVKTRNLGPALFRSDLPQHLTNLLLGRGWHSHQQRPTFDRRYDVRRRVRQQDQSQTRAVLLHRSPQRRLSVPGEVVGLVDDDYLEPLPRVHVDLLRLRNLFEEVLHDHPVIVPDVRGRDLEVVD